MNIRVKLTRRTINVTVEPTDTIECLKNTIDGDITYIDTSGIFFGGLELHDHEIIGACGIRNNSEVEFVENAHPIIVKLYTDGIFLGTGFVFHRYVVSTGYILSENLDNITGEICHGSKTKSLGIALVVIKVNHADFLLDTFTPLLFIWFETPDLRIFNEEVNRNPHIGDNIEIYTEPFVKCSAIVDGTSTNVFRYSVTEEMNAPLQHSCITTKTGTRKYCIYGMSAGTGHANVAFTMEYISIICRHLSATFLTANISTWCRDRNRIDNVAFSNAIQRNINSASSLHKAHIDCYVSGVKLFSSLIK